jgi:hypothetical protein
MDQCRLLDAQLEALQDDWELRANPLPQAQLKSARAFS